MSDFDEPQFILGVDFGSTTLGVKIYDQNADVISSTVVKVPYLYPEVGAVEIDPEVIWDLFVDVVKATFTKSDILPRDIKAFGFSCQRGTVTLWDKNTGKTCCNLLSWQDTRCANEVEEYNKSWMLKGINTIGTILYTFLRQHKFLLMQVMAFQLNQSSMRIIWFYKRNPEVHEGMKNGRIIFGSLDTWIIWKLTNGRLHVTDPSNASGTAMFDPFLIDWSIIAPIIGVPLSVFPQVLDTSGHICDVDEEIFGASIPLTALVADTQAMAFGQCCFQPGDAVCSIGTGCFLAINTGDKPHASIKGLYPQVGWKIGDEVASLCEGAIMGIAPSIDWAQSIGLFDDVSMTSDIAKTIEDTDGVYFIPGFVGLSAPYQDLTACTGLIGIKRDTTKAHMVRAILEGIAFRFCQLMEVLIEETRMPFNRIIKICGGVTNNDFIMELISSLTDCTLIRSLESDMSLLGAVYLAGLGAGIWKSKEEILALDRPSIEFEPNKTIRDKYIPIYKEWKKAVKRCLKWY